MNHPLRHRGKLILLRVTQNTHELQDVRVRQRIPENDLFAKLLGDGLSVISFNRESTFLAHLSDLFKVIFHREPQSLHCDGRPSVIPGHYIRKTTRD